MRCMKIIEDSCTGSREFKPPPNCWPRQFLRLEVDAYGLPRGPMVNWSCNNWNASTAASAPFFPRALQVSRSLLGQYCCVVLAFEVVVMMLLVRNVNGRRMLARCLVAALRGVQKAHQVVATASRPADHCDLCRSAQRVRRSIRCSQPLLVTIQGDLKTACS